VVDVVLLCLLEDKVVDLEVENAVIFNSGVSSIRLWRSLPSLRSFRSA
jgi:hypothetical protein